MENITPTKFQKIKNFYLSHKKLSIIGLIIIVVIGFFLLRPKASTETRYVTGTVEKGTIVASVSGTGQVETSNSIDLKANVSSNITYIGVKAGDNVKKGKLLFSFDSKTAQKAVRDAEANLVSAQLSLQKLQIQNSDANMTADLQKAYDGK